MHFPQAGQAEGETHLLVTAAGGDTGRQLDLFERLDYARHAAER